LCISVSAFFYRGGCNRRCEGQYLPTNNPWDHLVDVPYETLERMEEGPVLDLSFEGELVKELSTRPNRPVCLIERGKKRGVTSPKVLQRLGGWENVYEIPAEIINSYPVVNRRGLSAG